MSLYNNSNWVRKSAYSIFIGGIDNLSPLQSKLFPCSVKTCEEKLKTTLLGPCENLVGLTPHNLEQDPVIFFLCVYLHLRIDFSLLLIIILQT